MSYKCTACRNNVPDGAKCGWCEEAKDNEDILNVIPVGYLDTWNKDFHRFEKVEGQNIRYQIQFRKLMGKSGENLYTEEDVNKLKEEIKELRRKVENGRQE